MDLKVDHCCIGERGEVAVVRIVGEVDVYTFPKLREYLKAELLDVEEPPEHVGLDVAGVDWWDSCALGVCVGLVRQMRARRPEGFVAIVGATKRLRKIFKVTGLRNVFPLVESSEAFLDLIADPESLPQVWERVWGEEDREEEALRRLEEEALDEEEAEEG